MEVSSFGIGEAVNLDDLLRKIGALVVQNDLLMVEIRSLNDVISGLKAEIAKSDEPEAPKQEDQKA